MNWKLEEGGKKQFNIESLKRKPVFEFDLKEASPGATLNYSVDIGSKQLEAVFHE